jgi:hypothetical protein
MAVYKAPIKDIQFVLHEVHRRLQARSRSCRRYADIDADTIHAIVEEGGQALRRTCCIPAEPAPAIEEGCHLRERWRGHARPPASRRPMQAVRRGWLGHHLGMDPEFGGQGLPATWWLQRLHGDVDRREPGLRPCIPGLSATAPTRRCMRVMAPTELKERFLPKMVDGVWSGTMCLTEPQCGTDLGLVRTKAEPQGDGSYKHHRQQDLHLRRRARHDREHRPPRARPPAGRAGKGPRASPCSSCRSSCPRRMASRRPAQRRLCTGIEHKMGIHGNATCVMNRSTRPPAGWWARPTRACAPCS